MAETPITETDIAAAEKLVGVSNTNVERTQMAGNLDYQIELNDLKSQNNYRRKFGTTEIPFTKGLEITHH